MAIPFCSPSISSTIFSREINPQVKGFTLPPSPPSIAGRGQATSASSKIE